MKIFSFCSIDLSAEEGGGTVDLVAGGRDLQVTVYNVYDYVRKYAEYRMIKAQEKALEVREQIENAQFVRILCGCLCYAFCIHLILLFSVFFFFLN